MGCGCGRKRKPINKKNIAPKKVAKNRLSSQIANKIAICQKCSKSIPITRSIIVNKSKKRVIVRKKCKKLNRLIDEIVANKNYKCPLKKF